VLHVHDQQRLGKVRHDVGEGSLPDAFEGASVNADDHT
jgi:hypothetical protein